MVTNLKMVLYGEINFVDHFYGRGAFFGSLFAGGLGDLVVHMVFAVFVVYLADVLLVKKIVCYHIGKPNGERLAAKSKVKQKQIICGSAFQRSMMSNIKAFC